MPARLTPVLEDKFAFDLWDGPGNGTWEIAANSMKTYLAFAVKARAFDADPAVQQATELAGVNALAKKAVGKFSTAGAPALKAEKFDPEKLTARCRDYERLDQLVIDHIFGLNK
jgi:xylose isomerase